MTGAVFAYGLAVTAIAAIAIAVLLTVVPMWRIFRRAGRPGWAAIVPIFSQYTLCEVVGRPVWWLIWLLIPYLNIVFWLIFAIDLARAFGRSTGFGVGMWLLPIIFVPILGYGSAPYLGPRAAGAGLDDRVRTSYATCPTCGRLPLPGERFCAQCGTAVGGS